MNKKAQAWGMDLAVAAAIFSLGIVTFYIYTLNSSTETEEGLDKLVYQAEVVASQLFSEGSPANWNSSNVIRIGILTDSKVDEDKLIELYELVNSDYKRTQRLFNTEYGYYIEFSHPLEAGEYSISGVGDPAINSIEDVSSTNLIKVTRFTSYKGDLVTVYVYLWGER